MRTILILILLATAAAPPSSAQQVPSNEEVTFEPGTRELPIRFENLTLEDGLTQSSVYGMTQDSKGFMWFGTQIGLNRYDGDRIERFVPDPFDSTSVHDTYIWSITEDGDGYLWLTYEDGSIGRFDPATGRSRNYYSSPSDSTRPDAGRVTDLTIDSEGSVWFGGGFLQNMDPESGQVHQIAPPEGTLWFDTILEEPSGTMLVTGHRGVYRFDPVDESFEHLYETESGAIRAVYDPHEPGVVWHGSLDSGVFRFDTSTGDVRQYDVSASPVDQVVQALPDPSMPGVIWASTSEGISRLDVESGGYRTYQQAANSGTGEGELLSNQIGTIYADRSGILWASAEGSGVSRFDPTAIGFGGESSDPGDPNALRGQFVWQIYPAANDIVWVSAVGSDTFDPGWYLNRVDRRSGTVDSWQISSFYQTPLVEDADGHLLVGTAEDEDVTFAGGVYRYEPGRNTLVSRYSVASGHLPDDNINEMLTGVDGSVWVGTENGVAQINERRGVRRVWTPDPESDTAMHDGNIWRLFEHSEGDIWVAARRDLVVLDPFSGEITRFWDRPDAPADAEYTLARVITEDADGNVWIALTRSGAASTIMKYDVADDGITLFEHDKSDRATWSGGNVSGVHPHPSDPTRIYFATYGAGLSKLNTETGEFKHYHAEDGLLDPAVYTGIFDNFEMLWLPTNSGLYRFDPESETFRRFGLEYGLQSLEFNEGVLARSDNNELFFGGVQGFNAFFPSQLRSNDVPPDVAITEFLLFNERVTPGPNSPLETAISDTEEIRLAHDQDAPSFRFAALHYKRPEANRIRYRLEPEQTEWIDADGNHEASYTNLAPGEYTFRVIAANSDGVWNEEGAAVKLVITSPWWARWWAWLIYLAILGGLVFAADRIQRRRVVLKEREAARERELEQARKLESAHHELERSHEHLKATQLQLVEQEKLASLGSLTAGIAHEIKNPLNFVNNFAEVSSELAAELREAVESGDSETAKTIIADLLQNTDQIAKHGKRADGIVRSMMQHARGGSSEKETVDVNRFVEEYVDLAWHGMRARDHGFNADVEKDLDPYAGEMTIQSQEIGRVLVNLLNNAFQVLASEDGPDKGLVRVATERNGSSVQLRISDNGPGISPDIRSRIFEPFFTTKSTGEGTGLGLSLSYDIVTKAHGGTLTVGESPTGGAEFVITLPDNKP